MSTEPKKSEGSRFLRPLQKITEIRMIVCAALRLRNVPFKVIGDALVYKDHSSLHKAFKRFAARHPEFNRMAWQKKFRYMVDEINEDTL